MEDDYVNEWDEAMDGWNEDENDEDEIDEWAEQQAERHEMWYNEY